MSEKTRCIFYPLFFFFCYGVLVGTERCQGTGDSATSLNFWLCLGLGNSFHFGKKWKIESLAMDSSFKPEEYEEFLKERHIKYGDSLIYYPQACGERKHFNCV